VGSRYRSNTFYVVSVSRVREIFVAYDIVSYRSRTIRE